MKKIILVGSLIRLLLWPWIYHGDVNATYWWGKFASEFGLRGFYDWLNFGGYGYPDQPMLNIYYNLFIRQTYLFLHNFFWFLNINIPLFPSKFMEWFFINGNQYLLKIPMIIADILLIYVCYKFTKSKKIVTILAVYPPLIYNSAVWGSGDSIINLFALLAIYFFWKQKYYSSVLLYLFSILYKPSLLIWSPIIFVILLKNKISLKKIILLIFFTYIIIYFICHPFTPVESHPIYWFIKTMTVVILPGVMDLVTANAMNFWALIYGLEAKVDNFLVLNLINVRLLSILIWFSLYLHQIFKLAKYYSKKQILLSLASVSMITFTFMTRMHERYTYPALIPLILLSHSNKIFFKYFLILSFTHIINVYYVWQIPSISPLIKIIDTDFTVRLTSLVNILITLKLVFFSPNINTTNTKNKNPPPPKQRYLSNNFI